MITRTRLSSITSRVVAALGFAAVAALLSSAAAPSGAGATTLRLLASGDSSSDAPAGIFTSNSEMEVGYFDLSSSYPAFNGSGNGDNLLRLLNPTQVVGTLCAEIYVFDSEEEMGECCGCPVSPNGLDQISVGRDLLANWFISGVLPRAALLSKSPLRRPDAIRRLRLLHLGAISLATSPTTRSSTPQRRSRSPAA